MSSLSYSAPVQPESKSEPPTASQMGLNLLSALVLRRRPIGIVLLICLALGIFIAIVATPHYTANVSILPPQQSSGAASGLLSQLGSLGAISGMGGGSLKSPVELYAAFIQSQTVEEAMVEKFNLVDLYRVKRVSQARKMLEAHTTVDAKGKDGLVRVSVTDNSATRAAAMANGYIELTIQLSQHLAVTEASQRRLFLEKQLEQTKDKLADAEEALKVTENQTGIIQVEAQGRALIETTTSLRAQIAAKQVQLQSLKTFSADENPQVLELQQQLSTMRAQLASMEGRLDSGADESKVKLSSAGLEYIRKRRDVKYEETLFEILARQFEAAKMDEAREGTLLQIVDAARVPDYKSGPSRLLIVLGFLAAGLFGSVVWILISMSWLRVSADPLIAERLSLLRQSFSSSPRS